METEFTPLSALIGGLIIGSASVLLLLGNGRLAGISSIVRALVTTRSEGPRLERAGFLAGMIAGPFCVAVVAGWPDQTLVAGGGIMIAAGFLVGFGTVIGSGCTSGHGICGVARLSPRSIIASVVFVVVAIATVAVVNVF